MQSDGQRPFLILTKRRTGGTSLMMLMEKASRYPRLRHEPLNPQRPWGRLVAEFSRTGDVAGLTAALDRCLDDRPNIKHCYERLPEPVTEALIDLCHARGYALFHLVRRDEASRILSLVLAQATGAWHEDEAPAIQDRLDAGLTRLAPVDLGPVRRRFRKDLQRQHWVDDLLTRRGFACTRLVFEDLFRRDGDIATRAAAILGQTGIIIAPDDPALTGFASGRGQNSMRALGHLPNRARLLALLERLRTEVRARPMPPVGEPDA